MCVEREDPGISVPVALLGAAGWETVEHTHANLPTLLPPKDGTMNSTSLTQLGADQLEKARTATSGRAAVTVHGGHEHDLRQTVIALAEGRSLGEHESPGEATLQVLVGRVRLAAGDEAWEGGEGDHVVIPPHRHDLTALTDAVVLLTVATRA